MYPYLITGDTVTLVEGAKLHTMHSSHPNYTGVVEAVRTQKWEDALRLINPKEALTSFFEGTNLRIQGDAIYAGDTPIDNAMVPHIVRMHGEGFDVSPLTNLLARILANPSARSRRQIWNFVEANQITVTPEGNLLFYKKVRSNYFDVHTGTTNCYKVGTQHTMPRHTIDDDPEVTCSQGLHVCSLAYLSSFGGDRLLICEVDPADIVAVPIDYKHSKVRVSRLRVVAEVEDASSALTKAVESY